ncbi:MAG: DUF3445 domain-containing protein [Roseibium sp.]
MNVTPPFQHRPYDGSSHPFTVGLKPLRENAWLEPDPLLRSHLDEKDRLIAANLEAVFRTESDTDNAQREVLTLIADNLDAYHSSIYEVDPDYVSLRSNDKRINLSEGPALLTAARIVQEDLVIMRPGPKGYRLVAACLCFPSSWSLAEKFGQSMTGIHETVPGFNGSRMGQMVARVFENLGTEQILCRFNWSIYPDGQLHHPEARQIPVESSEALLAKIFLRVERQTLRRLPGSGDILFTIKIHHDPLSALSQQADQADVAEQLKTQLLALDDDQLAYKGLAPSRNALVEALGTLALGTET